MSAAFAPSRWPAPNSARSHGSAAWQLGQAVQLHQGDAVMQAMQWVLRRNCSMSPKALLNVYAMLCTVSLAIGSVFWWHGAKGVLPFAGLEALLLGLALLFYARHAGDRETITLAARGLQVEHQCGNRVQCMSFRAEWVSVEPAHSDASLIELSGEGRRIRVGRYLRPELRTALARELRTALRLVRARQPHDDLELGTPR